MNPLERGHHTTATLQKFGIYSTMTICEREKLFATAKREWIKKERKQIFVTYKDSL